MKLQFNQWNRKHVVIVAAIAAAVILAAVVLGVLCFSGGENLPSTTDREPGVRTQEQSQTAPAVSSSLGEGEVPASSRPAASSQAAASSRPASSSTPPTSSAKPTRPASGDGSGPAVPSESQGDSLDIGTLIPASSAEASASVSVSGSRPAASSTAARPADSSSAAMSSSAAVSSSAAATTRPSVSAPASTGTKAPGISSKEDDPSADWSPLRPL